MNYYRAGTFPPEVIAAAQASAVKWRVPASVTLAQWVLESGWGEHEPPESNNPFGIKAAAGEPYVSVGTREVSKGRFYYAIAKFRKFASVAEAFDDHGKLLAQGRPYVKVMAKVGDPDAFALALTGTYATDPNYGADLVRIMHIYDLTKFDVSATSPVTSPVNQGVYD